jgi:hypothetical protein
MLRSCSIRSITTRPQCLPTRTGNSTLQYLKITKGIKSKRKQFEAIREDPFYNALQIKFAYAVTCHKAQGGQWKRVFIDQGMFNRQDPTIEYLRWFYTAVTRATEKLYLVNFNSQPLNEFQISCSRLKYKLRSAFCKVTCHWKISRRDIFGK